MLSRLLEQARSRVESLREVPQNRSVPSPSQPSERVQGAFTRGVPSRLTMIDRRVDPVNRLVASHRIPSPLSENVFINDYLSESSQSKADSQSTHSQKAGGSSQTSPAQVKRENSEEFVVEDLGENFFVSADPIFLPVDQRPLGRIDSPETWTGCDENSSSPESYVAISPSSSSSPETSFEISAPIGRDSVAQKPVSHCLGSIDYPRRQEVGAAIKAVLDSVEEVSKQYQRRQEAAIERLNAFKERLLKSGGRDAEIHNLECEIKRLEKAITSPLPAVREKERQEARIQKIQDGCRALAAKFGKVFERDFEQARVLIEKAHRKQGIDMPPHEVALEALRTMDHIFSVHDRKSNMPRIDHERQLFHNDIYRTTLVIDGLLLSDLGANDYYNIEDLTHNPEGIPIRTTDYAFSENYTCGDVIAYAKQSDPHFQTPTEDADELGEWTLPLVDRFLDQEGVGLVERYRIYSAARQSLLLGECTDWQRERLQARLEHIKENPSSDPEVLDRQVDEYCRAILESGQPFSPPSQVEGWDDAFIAHFKTRFDGDALFDMLDRSASAENKISSQIFEVDRRNNCVHAHHLVSYPDPIDSGRQTHYLYARYDYVENKKYFEKRPTENFPHPTDVGALPRFPIARLAAEMKKKAGKAEKK